MAYGWRPKDVDELTWPELARLLEKIKLMPPANFVAAAWVNGQKPKPLAEQIGSLGLPSKKGKVRKRGDISR
jgi:hypothetical protein